MRGFTNNYRALRHWMPDHVRHDGEVCGWFYEKERERNRINQKSKSTHANTQHWRGLQVSVLGNTHEWGVLGMPNFECRKSHACDRLSA